MSNIIIAGEAKRKVVGVLRKSDHLSMLFHTWTGLAWELEVDEVNIKTLKDKIIVGTCFLNDAISAVIEDWVSKKGSKATLDVLVCALEKRGLTYIGECLAVEFGICKEQSTLEKNVKEDILFFDTLPNTIPYYIPRTLVSRYQIHSKRLFELASEMQDVFCFTGIQRFELAHYVKNSTTDNSSMQIQLRQISSRFIILDSDTHFSKICCKTPASVHWLEFSQHEKDKPEKILKWVKSSGNIEVIQRSVNYDSDQQENLTEAQILHSSEKDGNPVCFSDCPGMGKSILLINIGHKIKVQYPERITVHFELRYFVRKMKDMKSSNTKSIFESVLLKTLCGAGSSKATEQLKQIFSTDSVKIELLLDGFDEILAGDVGYCLQLIKDIKDLKCTRIWIASRPHFLERIENALNVLGYNIHPFTEENQKEFLSSYWLLQNKSLKPTKLTQLAEKSLKVVSLKTQDQNFAGIPLRCYLIAQVFKETAMNFCTAEFEHREFPELLTINSTFDLFTKMIEMKFRKYRNIYGATKNRQRNMTRMLMKLAIELIFPGYLEKIDTKLDKLDVSINDLINTGLLLQQREEVFKTGAKFIHQTVAEYFCARFVLSLFEQRNEAWTEGGNIFLKFLHFGASYVLNLVKERNEEWTDERKKFFFHQVLQLEYQSGSYTSLAPSEFYQTLASIYLFRTEFHFAHANKNSGDPVDQIGIMESLIQKFGKCNVPFAHPVVCYFLNSFLQKENGTEIFRINSGCSMNSFKDIIWICIRNNFLNIFKLLTCEPLSFNEREIFDRDFLFVLLLYGELDLVQLGFTYFEKHQKLDLNLKVYILSHVGKRGNYPVFAYFCKILNFEEVLLDGKSMKILISIIDKSKENSNGVTSQKVEIIRYILSVNPLLINIQAFGGMTSCHAELIYCLIELGLNVEAQDDSGNAFFHYVWQYSSRNSQILKMLSLIPLDKFKRLVHTENYVGNTILNQMLKFNRVSLPILDLFKTAKANFNHCNKVGNSLSMEAIEGKTSVEIVKYLLKEATNPNQVNESDRSVIFLWAFTEKSDMSILDELVKAGCDVFRQEEGCTFLHSLFISKYPLTPSDFHAVVQILIANGKEKLLETNSEREPKVTPLQLAVRTNQMLQETVTLLKSVSSLNFSKLLEEEVPDGSGSMESFN